MPASDRDIAQRCGQGHAVLGSADQGEQQLRHQDHALGLILVQAAQQRRHIQPAGTGIPDLRQRRQRHLRTGQQGRVQPGHVLQQGRQRHQAKMPTRCDGSRGIYQRRRHREQTVSRQAHALGATRGAGGVGDAGRGIRQYRSLDDRCHPPAAQRILLQRWEWAAGAGRRGGGRIGHHALRATGGQRVQYLAIGEEPRQWHVHGVDQT